MSEDRVCQGYRVIDSIRVDDTEVVLAHNPKAPEPYVTWKSYAARGFNDFAYGRYFSDEVSARANLVKRANELREYLPHDHPDKKPHGKSEEFAPPKPPEQAPKRQKTPEPKHPKRRGKAR